jgi:hypothetical protein
MTSKEAIVQVMAKEPLLTQSGFFQGWRWPRDVREATLRERREAMLTPYAIDEFERSCEWLKRQPRTKNLNRRAGTSYGLKHEAEKEVGYMHNGMFIAAAIACGFKVERDDNGPNAFMNISVRSVRDNCPMLN